MVSAGQHVSALKVACSQQFNSAASIVLVPLVRQLGKRVNNDARQMQSCGKATHCDFTENQQAKTTNFNIFEVDRWGLGQPKLRVGLSQLESDTKGFFNGCMKVGSHRDQEPHRT